MASRKTVRLFKPSGTALTLDGRPATLQGLTATLLKAVHEEELDLPTLIGNMKEVLTAREMSESFVEKWTPADSIVEKPDTVIVFDIQLEDWCNAAVIFMKPEQAFTIGSIGFKLSSSLFSSIQSKKARCLEGIFGMIHHVYGDSLNAEMRPDRSDPDQLLFRDSESICTVRETRSGGVFSGSARIVASAYKRSWWDPSNEDIRQFVDEA